MKKVLFVTSQNKQCGVYQYGRVLFNIISEIEEYDFAYAECSSPQEIAATIAYSHPNAILYNYHQGTMPYLSKEMVNSFRPITQIGFIHEITEAVIDQYCNIWDFCICSDPTLPLNQSRMFKTGRMIFQYENKFTVPNIVTVGSFGFGCAHKGYERLVQRVQDEFDDAIIRINMAFQTPGDADGARARERAVICQSLIKKPGIKLEVSHEFFSFTGLLDFLAKNTVNVFLYDDMYRGVSSTLDFALAVRRPIMISRSFMFRHMFRAEPSIIADEVSLRDVIRNGLVPLERFYDLWTWDKLKKDYELIFKQVL